LQRAGLLELPSEVEGFVADLARKPTVRAIVLLEELAVVGWWAFAVGLTVLGSDRGAWKEIGFANVSICTPGRGQRRPGIVTNPRLTVVEVFVELVVAGCI
jgi:hypothetical protein